MPRRNPREPRVDIRRYTGKGGAVREYPGVRYYDADGVCRRITYGSVAEAEFERARMILAGEVDKPAHSDGSTTLEAFWQVWLPDAKGRLAEGTVRDYEYLWRRRVQPRFGELAMKETSGGKEDFEDKMVELCAANGVAVVFVPEIPGTRASGAARWLSPSKALIQLSLRHKSDDHFWFSFFHEAGHLLLHSKKQTFVTGNGKQNGDLEDEANDFAASFLIPRRFAGELVSLRTPDDVRRFASRIGIAPGIVVGRLQNDQLLGWGTQANKLKRTIDFTNE